MKSLIARFFHKITHLLPLALVIHAVLVAFLTVGFTLVLLQYTNNKVDRLNYQIQMLTAANKEIVEVMLQSATPTATPEPTVTPSPKPLIRRVPIATGSATTK